jgi:hypothetical protein
VKKLVRIIALSAVSALYCFLISLYSSNALTYRSASSKLSTSESRKYNTFPISDLICHVAQATISAPASVTTPSFSLKNPFHGLWAWVNPTKQAFVSTFSQYIFYSQNLLIRFEKTDIIFPFHYFQ